MERENNNVTNVHANVSPNVAAKIRGAMLTGALGDVWGVPPEMRTQAFIKENYGVIQGFLPTKDNRFFHKAGFEGNDKGFYSDDTVLTFAIAKSLTEVGGVDIEDIFQKQIEGFHNFPYGFGNGTTMAFEKIEQGIPIQEISNPAGGGNGMMMKQFPLAAYFDVKNSDPKVEEKAILDITKVSHGHPAALVAAIVHHYFLKELLDANTQEIDKKSLLQKMKCIAQAQESKFIPREGKKISEVIEQIQAHINDKNELTLRDEEIYEQFGRGDNMKQSGFITTTLGVVYCLFLRNTGIQGVWDAVNFGGDTDTYASIIGNMSGALHGEIYNEDLLAQIQNIQELKQQTNDFIYALLGEGEE